MKKNKNDIKYFFIILLLSLIICSGFIRMHYTTDTYKIIDEGYDNYAKKWSFKDGRIIMFGLLEICEIINLPIAITNYILTVSAIAISCIAIINIKNIILGLKDTNNTKEELLVLILSYLIVFNFMYIEAIYFLEIIVISLSIWLFVLGTKVIIENKRFYIIKALILVSLGVTAYQGTISFFIAFTFMVLIIKNKKIDSKFIKKIIAVAFITLVALVINIIVVKISSSYVGLKQNRFNINNIVTNLIYILNNFDNILLETCGILPKYLYITILITEVILSLIYLKMCSENFTQNYIKLMLIIIITLTACFSVFLATLSSFDCARMYIILGALPSMVLVYLYVNIQDGKNERKFIILYFGAILWLVLNIVTYILRIEDSRYKNVLEKNYCNNIYNYFIDNNITLEKACIIPVKYDANMIYFSELKTKNKMTINEIRGYESAISGFNINIGCKLEEVKADSELKEKYMIELKNNCKGINESYSMFIDNTLVMPVFVW